MLIVVNGNIAGTTDILFIKFHIGKSPFSAGIKGENTAFFPVGTDFFDHKFQGLGPDINGNCHQTLEIAFD